MPLLFSYGTLQQDEVQVATFGRLLHGQRDELVGFEQSVLSISDPYVVETSGKTEHLIVSFTGDDQNRVSGMVFEITDDGHGFDTATVPVRPSETYAADGMTALESVLEKGVAWRRLRVRGTPGHGSMPFGADNALVKAAEIVRRVRNDEQGR